MSSSPPETFTMRPLALADAERAAELVAAVEEEYGSRPVTSAAHGYLEVRRFYGMEIELDATLPAAQWPPGIRVEPFQRDDARAFFDTLEEAFADEWGHRGLSFEEWLRLRVDSPDADHSVWFLARDGDEVAAVIRCDASREEMGWIGALGVRHTWRRRGLGLALLLHTCAEFRRRGKKRVGLGVDAENPTGATRLYERAGMHVAIEEVVFEKALA